MSNTEQRFLKMKQAIAHWEQEGYTGVEITRLEKLFNQFEGGLKARRRRNKIFSFIIFVCLVAGLFFYSYAVYRANQTHFELGRKFFEEQKYDEAIKEVELCGSFCIDQNKKKILLNQSYYGEYNRLLKKAQEYYGKEEINDALSAIEESLKYNQDGNDALELRKKCLPISGFIAVGTAIDPTSKLPLVVRCQKDGAEMILITSGEFMMGADTGKGDEKPVHAVYLDPYYIDKYEVTVKQYIRSCAETKHQIPNAPSWGWQDNHPIVNVRFDDALTYCQWAGKRLPTEAEWEKAARGRENWLYPWGNEWDKSKCNNSENNHETTTPVGKYEVGKSLYGCYDMAGNVWEWCSDWYEENYYKNSPKNSPRGPAEGIERVIRGGSWKDQPKYMRTSNRSGFKADYYSDDTGFRAVVSVSEGQ